MRFYHRISFFFLFPILAVSAFGQRELYPKQQGKDQDLHLEQLPRWVSFDGELRGRSEYQSALGEVTGRGRYYELSRVRSGFTLRPAPWLSTYLQFQDTHALGLSLRNVAAGQRNQFDFFQGYVNLNLKKTNLFVGRQILRFGDERVIGPSDWINNSRSWDGADLRIGSKNKIDLFTTSVVVVTPTSLDKHGAGLTYHGAFATLGGIFPGTTVIPFVIVRALPRVISQQNTAGTETEETFGSYYETKLPLGFQSSGTGVLQRGSFSSNSIHSGAGIIRGGWVAEKLPWQPHIEGEYNYATGNTRRNPTRVSTYDQQYPSNHNAFGLVDLFGFQNIKQDRLSIFFTPIAKSESNFQMLFQTGSLHLATTRDSLYNITGGVLQRVPARGFVSDGIGTEFDASAKYIYHQVFITNVGVGHLFPGRALTTTGRAAPLTLGYLQFTYRFKLGQ